MSQGKRQRQARKRLRDYDLSGRRLAVLSVNDLHTDAERFQYKINPSNDGAVGSLAGVAVWSPASEGILDVWECPIRRKIFVVNGHNRLWLAKRLGIRNLPCKFLPAETSSQAREMGAIANIAAGCGSVLDAAKFFRDGHWDKERCRRHGIKLSGPIARDGLAIARLCPELFNWALSGTLAIDRAAILGAAKLSEPQQISIATALDRRDRDGQETTPGQLRELMALHRIAATATVTQTNLFGTIAHDKTLIFETAFLHSEIKARLGSDRRLYRAAARGADTLESAHVGTVDRDLAETHARQQLAFMDAFNRRKLEVGPVSEAIAHAAQSLAQGGNRRAILDRAYSTVLSALGTA
jgi:hypothetical protein